MMPYDPTKESLYTPYTRPTNFSVSQNRVTHMACAELSRLVYLPFEKDQVFRLRLLNDLRLGGFELIRVFNNEDTQAMLVKHITTEQHVLIFRGTEPHINDWLINALFLKKSWSEGTRVHYGFAKAFEFIWHDIKLATKDIESIIFTGHSLGAALATLAASRLRDKCKQLVTMGSPRVGNAAFAKSMSSIDSVRYVDCCDLVTKVPPAILGYEHVNTERYINRDGYLATKTVNDQDLGNEAYEEYYSSLTGNLKIRGLADHSPINYVRVL